MMKGGGGATNLEGVLTWELEVLAILMGGGVKRGALQTSFTLSRGGGGCQKLLLLSVFVS